MVSRTKAHWRRIAAWVDQFKGLGAGFTRLQSWEDPLATLGAMAGICATCCYPHIVVSLAAAGLVFFMVRASDLCSMSRVLDDRVRAGSFMVSPLHGRP